MARSEHIKMNWYPALTPPSVRVMAKRLQRLADFDRARRIRQFRHSDGWLAVALDPHNPPDDFVETEIPVSDFPMLVSTFISDAFLAHFRSLGFRIDAGKGESFAYHSIAADGMPSALIVYEGLRIKPYFMPHEDTIAFGLFIDFASSQEFTHSLAEDSIQIGLAREGYEVVGELDGFRVVGILQSTDQTNGNIAWRDKNHTLPLASLRLQANYETIQAYLNKTPGSRQGRATVRQLLMHSLALTQDGYRNLNHLADRYRRVSDMLCRERNANLNIRLGTVCQSLVSIATEPMDLEVRL